MQAEIHAVSLANSLFEKQPMTFERDGDGNPVYHETNFEQVVEGHRLFEFFAVLPDEAKKDVIRTASGLAKRDPARVQRVFETLPYCLNSDLLEFETLKLVEVMFELSQHPLDLDEVPPGLRRSLPILAHRIDEDAEIETGKRVKSAAVLSYIAAINCRPLTPYLRIFLDPTNRWGNSETLFPDCAELMREEPARARTVIRQLLVEVVDNGSAEIQLDAVGAVRNALEAARRLEKTAMVIDSDVVEDVRTALRLVDVDGSEDLRNEVRKTRIILNKMRANRRDSDQ